MRPRHVRHCMFSRVRLTPVSFSLLATILLLVLSKHFLRARPCSGGRPVFRHQNEKRGRADDRAGERDHRAAQQGMIPSTAILLDDTTSPLRNRSVCVFLKGEMFRSGRQGDRVLGGTTESIAEQKLASESQRDHILFPLQKLGARVLLFMDTYRVKEGRVRLNVTTEVCTQHRVIWTSNA